MTLTYSDLDLISERTKQGANQLSSLNNINCATVCARWGR